MASTSKAAFQSPRRKSVEVGFMASMAWVGTEDEPQGMGRTKAYTDSIGEQSPNIFGFFGKTAGRPRREMFTS